MFPDEPVPSGPRLSAHPSIAVELDWALSAAHRPGDSAQPVLDEIYRRHPDLAGKVRALWAPEEQLSYPGYLELSVIAHHAGVLFSPEPGDLLDVLEDAAATAPRKLTLASEKPEDRVRILRRLDLLRSSPARRRKYAVVMRQVWDVLDPLWEPVGRRAVEAAVASRHSLLARSSPSWREFAGKGGCPETNLEKLVEMMRGDDELAVVPAYFCRKGLIFDLPGVVVVGVTAEPAGAESRVRTEGLARQLKAISDPTRLALLDALARRSLTITELADMFDLAQPTVSNHIKVLRDAGVVGHDAALPRNRLTVRHQTLKELMVSLQDVLEPDSSS